MNYYVCYSASISTLYSVAELMMRMDTTYDYLTGASSSMPPTGMLLPHPSPLISLPSSLPHPSPSPLIPPPSSLPPHPSSLLPHPYPASSVSTYSLLRSQYHNDRHNSTNYNEHNSNTPIENQQLRSHKPVTNSILSVLEDILDSTHGFISFLH